MTSPSRCSPIDFPRFRNNDLLKKLICYTFIYTFWFAMRIKFFFKREMLKFIRKVWISRPSRVLSNQVAVSNWIGIFGHIVYSAGTLLYSLPFLRESLLNDNSCVHTSLVSRLEVYLKFTSGVNRSNCSVSRLLCSRGNDFSSKEPKYNSK